MKTYAVVFNGQDSFLFDRSMGQYPKIYIKDDPKYGKIVKWKNIRTFNMGH
jgi:hypothetical protein